MTAASEFASLRYDLRKTMRDDSGFQWSDAVLNSIINQAQREYSLYSGKLCGDCEVFSSDSDIHFVPDDFIEPLKFVDSRGNDIPFVSWVYLNELYPDFRKITGTSLQYICFDFDGYGKFRLFPHLLHKKSVGKLFYRRVSQDNVMENCNPQAVRSHCLYQMCFFAGKATASNYWEEFLSLVNKESRSDTVLKNRQKSRHGSFF